MADLVVEHGMTLETAPPVERVPEAVPEGEIEVHAEAPPNPRDEALKSILANRQKQLDKELLYASEMTGQPLAEPAQPEPVEAQPEPVSPVPVVAAPQAPPQPSEPTRRNIAIGNQVFSLTDAELEQLAIYGAQSLAQPQAQPQRAAPVPPAPVPLLDDETAKGVARRIAFGNEEDGAKALQEMVSGVIAKVATPQVDPQRLADVATQQAMARINYQTTLERIAGEYQDVFNDEGLSILAGREARNLIQKYGLLRQSKPELEVYREACQSVREKYIAPRQPQPGPVTTEAAVQAAPAIIADRLERKRAAPRPPASAGRIASLNGGVKVPTGSEIVDQMRRARGQPAYN